MKNFKNESEISNDYMRSTFEYSLIRLNILLYASIYANLLTKISQSFNLTETSVQKSVKIFTHNRYKNST